jgi:hypothetical protein
MGACDFTKRAKGKTADEAFDAAVREAQYEHGHGGYTGTIAEKHSFVLVPVPAGEDPRATARAVLDGDESVPSLAPTVRRYHSQVDDKWGPAGCVQTAPGEYLFFGWASE